MVFGDRRAHVDVGSEEFQESDLFFMGPACEFVDGSDFLLGEMRGVLGVRRGILIIYTNGQVELCVGSFYGI